eukprot:124541-Amphidinium_carterae.1
MQPHYWYSTQILGKAARAVYFTKLCRQNDSRAMFSIQQIQRQAKSWSRKSLCVCNLTPEQLAKCSAENLVLGPLAKACRVFAVAIFLLNSDCAVCTCTSFLCA